MPIFTRREARFFVCFAAAALMLLVVSAAQASAATRVRFLQAVPRGGSAQLEVTSPQGTASAGGRSTFGQMTPYAAVASGHVKLVLVSGSAHATKSLTLAAHERYTVLALGRPGHPRLRIYADGAGRAGLARLRLIQAAPELGAPDLRLSGRLIAQGVHFRQSTGYIDVMPGSYRLAAMAPRQSQPIVERSIALTAGTATTAVLVGTAGAPEQLVVASDATVAPAGPPETGLGGLASGGGRPWLLIGLAGLAGGGLAGLLHRRARRRGAR